MCSKYLWTQTTVKRLLQNEIYTGTLVNHKTVTSKIYKTKSCVPSNEQYRHENFLPKIIDEQTWDKTQRLLEQRYHSNARASNGRAIHRYCGLIKCAECGAILIAKRRSFADGTEWIEYTCNSHHRYGKEYCTPHRIREEQLDRIVTDEVLRLKDTIKAESEKYEQIIKNWLRDKPKYDEKIRRYQARIALLREQIENLVMERIGDREHAQLYNDMIAKRENEIACLENKIAENRNYDLESRKKKEQLKTAADVLEDMLKEPKITNSALRLLVEGVLIHQNEDKSIDVKITFNGDFKAK